MSELNNNPNLDHLADDIVSRWFDEARTSEDGGDRFVSDVLAPAVRADGLLGITVLDRLGRSDEPRARFLAAAYMSELPAETPKDRYLVAAQHLLTDENHKVFHAMWESLRDNASIELSWGEVSAIIDDEIRGDLLRTRPEWDADLPPVSQPPHV